MATDAGELVVKISADIADMKAALQVASQNVGSLGAETVAAGNIMSGAFEEVGRMAIKFATDSIEAFGQQEQTLLRLSNLVGTDAADSFEKFAAHIEETTAFSHEQVLAMDAQLAAFGIMPDQIQKASGALIDYAAQTGKTLPEAAGVLGRAMAGNSRELKALGVEIFSTDDRTTKFNKTIDTLNEKFAGVAEQMSGTTLGGFEQLKNAFTDLEQQVGKFLVSSGGGFSSWLTGMIKNLVVSMETINSFITEIGGIGHAFEAVFLEVGREVIKFLIDATTLFGAWNPILKLVGINIDSIKASLDKKIDSMQKDIQLTNTSATTAVKAEKNKVVAISDTQRTLDQYLSSLNHSIEVAKIVSDNIVEIADLETQKRILDSEIALGKMESDQHAITVFTEQETEKRLLTSQQAWETNASFSTQFGVKLADDIDKNTSDWVNMANGMFKSFSDATSKMIVEGGRFSDVMKNFWQQLAEQVISQIIRMIAEWIVFQAMTGGAGGGFGGGFLSGIGHMAGGGMINEPSMLVGLRTGSRHLVGEAGPEAVVPTGGNQSGLPGGDSSGANITVNISGQFIEASESKWNRLVQEQIIPQLRRFSMTQPNGVVNRKRGASV